MKILSQTTLSCRQGTSVVNSIYYYLYFAALINTLEVSKSWNDTLITAPNDHSLHV